MIGVVFHATIRPVNLSYLEKGLIREYVTWVDMTDVTLLSDMF